jgi:hypothetical protein
VVAYDVMGDTKFLCDGGDVDAARQLLDSCLTYGVQFTVRAFSFACWQIG